MTFVVPKLQTSFCRCTLATGTKIIACLLAGSHILLIVIVLVVSVIRNKVRGIATLFLWDTFVIQTVFSFVLFYGVYTRNRLFIMPWVLLQAVSQCMGLCMTLVLIFAHMFGAYLTTLLPFTILQTGVEWYFILVVYNYYRELKEHQLSSGIA